MEEGVKGRQVEWEVLDPSAEYEKLVYQPAPRLPDLNHRKIGLYWNGKPDGDVLLNAIGELLRDRFEGIDLLTSFTPQFPLTPKMIKQIAEESDAVISSIGD